MTTRAPDPVLRLIHPEYQQIMYLAFGVEGPYVGWIGLVIREQRTL